MSTSTVTARRKPFYKKWWVWLLALLAIVIVASAIGGSNDPPTPSSPASGSPGSTADSSSSSTAESQLAKVGEPARDGKFEFVVEGINCDETSVGTAGFTHEAQGKFCIARIKVTNIGDKAQTFSGSNATLINKDGQQYAADLQAAAYMDNAESVYTPINPGNSVEAQVAWDVPRETVPDRLDLHDSLLSSGVQVQL